MYLAYIPRNFGQGQQEPMGSFAGLVKTAPRVGEPLKFEGAHEYVRFNCPSLPLLGRQSLRDGSQTTHRFVRERTEIEGGIILLELGQNEHFILDPIKE